MAILMSFGKIINFIGSLCRRPCLPSRAVIEGVPYFSQWESAFLVGEIIRGEISAQDDPLWKNSGAKTAEEYQLWAKNMCGMACLKMIIAHKLKKTIAIMELGKGCSSYGGYKVKSDAIDGLFYAPFVKFVKQEFGLTARAARYLPVSRIIRELSRNNYVIASVSHEIRHVDSQPSTRGGHLILVLGYNLQEGTLLFHNPSGDTPESQEYVEMQTLEFNKFFARRGIIIEG